MLLLLALACHTQPWPRGEPCACDAGQGVALCDRDGSCGPCMCLVPQTSPRQIEVVTSYFLDPDVAGGGDGSQQAPWTEPDWVEVDRSLQSGAVALYFSASEADGSGPETWPERVIVQRSGASAHTLLLDGWSWTNTDDASPSWRPLDPAPGEVRARARVPGIGTGFDVGTVVSHVTVRGFELTGSKDKGVQWLAGDDIVVEDNHIHGNKGTPAVSLGYSRDTGHVGTTFHVRRNHIHDQPGECIYIGGSGGDDADSHQDIVVEENLVHGCWHPWSSQHDGINIKDRLREVVVRRNVVFGTDWGIELASPGLVEQNLVFSTRRNGFHLTDAWGLGLSGLLLLDNVVINPGDAGVYLNASNYRWSDVTIDGLSVIGAAEAGVESGGPAGIDGLLDRVLLVDNAVGFDAWDPVGLEVGDCWLFGNDQDDDRDWSGVARDCSGGDPGLGDRMVPAGPDLVFFTVDDVGAPDGAWGTAN